MVLSMLSPVSSVKLPTSTQQQQQQQPPQLQQQQTDTNSKATSPSVDGSNCRPANVGGDMSRRKQKNPKPCFSLNDDQENESKQLQEHQQQQQQHSRRQQQQRHDDDGHNNNLNSSFNSNQSDEEEMDPPEDLSSLVKVEMEEGFGPVIDTVTSLTTRTTSTSTERRTSPTFTPSPPPPPTSRLPLTPGFMPIPPPPPLSRHHDHFPPGLLAKDVPNMFHFGDVSVSHHPDTAPVPMVIPMVYLYPLPSHDQGQPEVRYRMFVPLGAPVEALPGFPPASSAPHLIPDLCVTPNNVPASFSMKTASRKSTTHETNVTTTTPLDLRKSPGTRSEGSTSGHGDDDSSQDMRMQSPSNAARSPSESRQTPDPHSAKQKEFEAQLQFLKAKQIEFFQTQQKQAAAAAAAAAAVAAAKMSRCEECNINFSKYQNYVAHKKYYCSASAKAHPPPAPVQVASDNEDDEPVAGPAPKIKQENGPHARATPTPPRPQKSPASNTSLASPNGSNDIAVKELKLVKPQDLLQDPAPALVLPGIPANHFVCDGCGIKFKSVSNLQAHQARYCAGLRKSEDMSPIEAAILKRNHQQQQKQNRVSPPQLPLPLTAADMMTFLNAKSIEQQLAVAAAQAAAAAAITKDKQQQPPSISSVMAVATALAGTSAGVVSNGNNSEDYCCILCGYKEQSVERLKDHINLHFISQMKRPMQTSTSKSPRTASNGSASTNGSGHEDSGPPEPKRIKIEPAIVSPSREDSDDAAKTPAEVSSRSVTSPSCPPLVMIPHPSPKISEAAILRCESCNIGFSHLSNLMAHKKFYCRGVQPVGAERSNSP